MIIKFKNIVSGPAPIGRILNYIFACGFNELLHKNGYRSINFQNNIGCAWTTEFMFGLDLLKIEGTHSKIKNAYITKLTKKGMILYNLIYNNFHHFSEQTKSASLLSLKNQMLLTNKKLYNEFKKIFKNSPIFSILSYYLSTTSSNIFNKTDFINNYFLFVAEYLNEPIYNYNSNAKTTTAENRVISTLQLCFFFDFLSIDNDILTFNFNNNNNQKSFIEEFDNTMLDIEKKLKTIDITKYGIDGTSLVTSIVRNSFLQQTFKFNLLSSFHNKCCICGSVFNLIGSHIKPAVICDAKEKVDNNNGLLLCPNHDALFDKYLISFHHKTGKIMINKHLLSNKDQMKILNINNSFTLRCFLNADRSKYLEYHNNKFFEKEKETNL